ncbi:MAG: zinc ribbon domain-containing protein [Bacilli bacterium]|nr:zinc ribbon domain-containing protein [Bacilli bacterium]
MNCPNCGREITSNKCPYCGYEQIVNNYTAQNNLNNQNAETLQMNEQTPVEKQETVPVNNTQVVENTQVEEQTPNQVTNKVEPPKHSIAPYLVVVPVILAIVVATTYYFTKMKLDKPPVERKISTVYLDGYTYKLPEPLKYSIEENRLIITNKEKNYRLIILPTNNTYAQYKAKVKALQKLYTTQGYKVKKPQTKTFSKVEYLTMEMAKDGRNYLLTITEGANANSYVIVIETGSNNIDYSILEDMTEVIESISYKATISARMLPEEDGLLAAHKVLIK